MVDAATVASGNVPAGLASPPAFWLVVHAKPKSQIRLYLTLPPDATRTYTVEKYSSRYGTTFEKHIEPNGVETWWKLVAPGYKYDWRNSMWVKS